MLGFTPIATSTIGGSPHLIAASQQLGGVLAQTVVGLSASGYVGGVTVTAKAGASPSGLSAGASVSVLGSLSATTPQMTTFASGFPLSSGLGIATGSPQTTALLSISPMSGLLGAATGFAVTTYVSGVQSTVRVGAIGAGDRWVDISPSTAPNWTDVTIL